MHASLTSACDQLLHADLRVPAGAQCVFLVWALIWMSRSLSSWRVPQGRGAPCRQLHHASAVAYVTYVSCVVVVSVSPTCGLSAEWEEALQASLVVSWCIFIPCCCKHPRLHVCSQRSRLDNPMSSGPHRSCPPSCLNPPHISLSNSPALLVCAAASSCGALPLAIPLPAGMKTGFI